MTNIDLLNKSIKTPDVIAYLQKKYSDTNQWTYFKELRAGTGFAEDAQRYIDFWVINAFASKNWEHIAYEIKVSRSDWLTEFKKPLKKRMGLLLSNSFYFIAPKGIIKTEEVPLECGLIELEWTDNQKYIDNFVPGWRTKEPPPYELSLIAKTVINAPWRDVAVPSWKFIASLCRRINFEENHQLRHEVLEEIDEATA